MNFDLFQPLAPLPERNDELLTWILLVHRTHSEVFCELSLPSAMGNDGRVDFWQERVIIGAIPMEYDPVEIAPPSMPDIDVDVKRKA